jgi:hypothetical protein
MRRTLFTLVLAGAMVPTLTAFAPGAKALTAAPAAPGQANSPGQVQYTTSTETLTDVGTVNLSAIAGTHPSAVANSSGRGGRGDGQPLGHLPRTGSQGKPVSAGSFSVVTGNVAGETGFPGVTENQEAAVNAPNSITPTFSDATPPDQGTCAGPDANGNPIAIEIVNNALAAYSQGGTTELAVTPTWALFKQPDTAFMSDPRCYYDAPTGRWFFTEFIDGALSTPPGPSTQFVAVSQTSDPLGNYTVFGWDTTDASNPLGDCPCFGDFDQVGADANGIYVTTNEFANTNVAPGYNGTVLYALPKQGLEAAASGTGSRPGVTRYAITADAFGASTPTMGNGPYHVSPASTPAGGTYAPNTEFLVESNSDLFADNHLIVYALTGTNLLASGGTPALSATELTSEAYSFPPNATQENGPLPLGNTFGITTPNGLAADFNAVQESTYTDGSLYTELDTAVGATSTSPGNDGIGWFALAPSTSGSAVTASIVKQGYVSNSQNLIYPDLVLDGAGHGYLDFAVSGSAEYPSAAYVAFHTQPTGPIHLAAAGTAPEDDFGCYPPFGNSGTGCRWGDYSGGAVWDGRAYLMTEYVPALPRDSHGNWGTFVWSAPVH